MTNYNKTSCRACGSYLIATAICTICKEYVNWICPSCERMDDVSHIHDYCRVSHIEKLAISVNAANAPLQS